MLTRDTVDWVHVVVSHVSTLGGKVLRIQSGRKSLLVHCVVRETEEKSRKGMRNRNSVEGAFKTSQSRCVFSKSTDSFEGTYLVANSTNKQRNRRQER